jgi:hypothetical protein
LDFSFTAGGLRAYPKLRKSLYESEKSVKPFFNAAGDGILWPETIIYPRLQQTRFHWKKDYQLCRMACNAINILISAI